MKKLIKKYWGIVLIVVMLSTLFVSAMPAAAADPLIWNVKIDAPSAMFSLLAPGTDVIDFATNDGITMYAITRTYVGITADVTTAYVDGGDLLPETYTFTYVNELGTIGRTGTVVIAASAGIGAAGAITLQAGDTGVTDITNVNATRVVGDSAVGAWRIRNAALTVLATFTLAGVIADGAANPGTDALMQSAMGGAMWTNITARLPVGVLNSLDYLAMAPDDSTFVVVASATATAAGLGAAVTTDAGATFSSMGSIRDNTAVLALTFKGVTVAPIVTGNVRYIAIYGQAVGGGSALYYYNYGAGVGSWKNAVVDFNALRLPAAALTMDNIVAFAFSPNFPSDYMGVALSEDVGGVTLGTLRLHILSFNSLGWDVPVAAGYPVVVSSTADANVLTAYNVLKADLALLPDYDGGDESLRIVFASAAITDASATTGAADGGVWRCYDAAPAAKILGTVAAGVDIFSVAYDGTTVAAGSYDTNGVFRSADPMVTGPTFLPARNLKKIGIDDATGNDLVKVRYAGTTLLGAKRGVASAISKSLDYGNVWNDFTLLDSALTAVDDIYMSPTGDPWYISARDAFTSCVYRISMFSVTRVLCVAVGPDFMLKGVAADPNVLYAADEGGTILYYTADGGLTRWYLRGSVPAAITDLAVESKEIIYVGSGISVYKSTNSGFTWSLPVNCKLAGANVINQMVSLGDSKLLIGGTAGGVVWSTDGGTSYFAAMGVFFGGALQVTATGLATGDYVFAADEANNSVWRCEISPANFLGEFKSMNMAAATAAETNIGLMLTNGVLYALSSGGGNACINRTLTPTIAGTHTQAKWGTRNITIGLVPGITSVSALRVSSGAPGSIILYTVAFGMVWYFDDNVALTGPTLIGPADGKLIQIISPLTGATQQVNFTWNRLSLATTYTLQIALDSAFNEDVTGAMLPVGPGTVTSSLDPVSFVLGAGNVIPGTTYYWRVQVRTPIASAWSETRSFIVQPTAATVPDIGAPVNGASNISKTPSFSWSAVSGTTKYEFQLSNETTFATPMVSQQIATTAIQPTATLEAGKTYFWRVRALEPVQGDWSSVANFTVAVPATPAPPPVTIVQQEAPKITITQPAAPVITMTQTTPDEIAPVYIWAIIIIGAVLVIAVIVLIVRTRRSV